MSASTATKTDSNIEYVWYASSERAKFGTLLRCYGIAKMEGSYARAIPSARGDSNHKIKKDREMVFHRTFYEYRLVDVVYSLINLPGRCQRTRCAHTVFIGLIRDKR